MFKNVMRFTTRWQFCGNGIVFKTFFEVVLPAAAFQKPKITCKMLNLELSSCRGVLPTNLRYHLPEYHPSQRIIYYIFQFKKKLKMHFIAKYSSA